MIQLILLIWVGVTLKAPTLYWVILGLGMAYKFTTYGIALYKLGKESEEK